MSTIAEDCINWIMNAVNTADVFQNKVFEVYDPGILQEIAAKLNYPVCGIVYEGISSEQQGFDQGVSTNLSIGIVVLSESRARDVRQTVDKKQITVVFDKLRTQIIKKLSPANTPWQFVIEIPIDMGDRGHVYYQKWKTKVIV